MADDRAALSRPVFVDRVAPLQQPMPGRAGRSRRYVPHGKGSVPGCMGLEKGLGRGFSPPVDGGNSAVDCARVCRRLGADVEVVYRRSQAEMPAHPDEVLLAVEEGGRFRFLASPKDIDELMIAHRIPYLATATADYPHEGTLQRHD